MEFFDRASIEFSIKWQSKQAEHIDRTFLRKVNFWRDYFPAKLEVPIKELNEGDKITQQFNPGELTPHYDLKNKLEIENSLVSNFLESKKPQKGRFYPRSLIVPIGNSFPNDLRPFRYLSQNGEHTLIDLNHPLSKYEITFETSILKKYHKTQEWGGQCNDIAQSVIEHGPGLQASNGEIQTEFYTKDAFVRQDYHDDSEFYKSPRLVHHLDETARKRIQEIYAQFLKPDMKVLDLMSSWVSHLPERNNNYQITGLGLNEKELGKNRQLSDYLVHDLNKTPKLPFPDASFDLAVCTASVEYVIKPFEIFAEIARILKPKSSFVVTFSERWFPPKVIKLWTELHPFERLGLVLDYFQKSGLYTSLQTETIRGYPRPKDDKYYPQNRLSDPVYVVWGKTR